MHSRHGQLELRSGALRMLLAVGALAALAFMRPPGAQADYWHSGNRRPSAYGISAYIYTPSSAPYIASGGSYHWVSLPLPNWVQTGWAYFAGMSGANQYVEHCVNDNHALVLMDPQSWGTPDKYTVQFGGYATWYAYINDNSKGAWGPISAPTEVQAFSEVHESSANVIDTRFSGVSYRPTEYGSYTYFDQANWLEQGTYHIQKDNNYYYRTYGP